MSKLHKTKKMIEKKQKKKKKKVNEQKLNQFSDCYENDDILRSDLRNFTLQHENCIHTMSKFRISFSLPMG